MSCLPSLSVLAACNEIHCSNASAVCLWRCSQSGVSLFRSLQPSVQAISILVSLFAVTFCPRNYYCCSSSFSYYCQLSSEKCRRQLRSADSRTCVVRGTYSNFGDRCFAAAGTRLWNSLPESRHWLGTVWVVAKDVFVSVLRSLISRRTAHCDCLNCASVRFRRGRKFVVLVVGGRAASW